MDFIIDAITEWIKDFLIEAITGNLSNMFGDVNTKVATIAGEVGKTPEQWNSGVFSMIHSLSESVIVPIAGLVIAAVLSYELIRMVIDRNNMHDFDTFIFFKWIIKAGIAAYVVSHANLKYKYGRRVFWAKGYYVSTVGGNKKAIQKYIQEQEREDQIMDQLSFKEYEDPFKDLEDM